MAVNETVGGLLTVNSQQKKIKFLQVKKMVWVIFSPLSMKN